MFEVMAELEALCAGYAAERMTNVERRALEDSHEELRVIIHSGDPQRYHEVNEAFHSSIYTGAHNNYLAELTLSTRARVQPFRCAQFRNLGRLAKSHIEHDRVVQAILRGEQGIASSVMYAHIVTVREEYEHYTETI
jgi:DNA-binding GntR family transcriptional regulator